MSLTPVNSVMHGSTAATAVSTGGLGRGQAVRLTGLGILLCFSGALFIRHGIPAGLFGGRAGIVLFALSVPLAPTLVWTGERVGALRQDQLISGVTLMSAVAVLCGGIALTWFPALYGDNPASHHLGAAWLLFDVGVNLIAALFISIRRTS
jgi:hypothetical protein